MSYWLRKTVEETYQKKSQLELGGPVGLHR